MIREIFITLLLLTSLSNLCMAANIFVESPSTVVIEGLILKGDFDKFLTSTGAIQGSGYSVTKVETRNSIGGSTYQGMLIGSWIMEHQVDTVAVGICGSSCANHIFLSGKSKELRGAVLAFHGSPISTEALFPERINNQSNLGINEDYHENLADAQYQRSWVGENQKEFYRLLDVNHEFFFASGSPRNLEIIGCNAHDQMWVPTIVQMQQYGVQGVFGSIDEVGAQEYCFNPEFERSEVNDVSMRARIVSDEELEKRRALMEVDTIRYQPTESLLERIRPIITISE